MVINNMHEIIELELELEMDLGKPIETISDEVLDFDYLEKSEKPKKVYSRKGKSKTKSTNTSMEVEESPEPPVEKKEGSSAMNPVDLLASEPSQLEPSQEM